MKLCKASLNTNLVLSALKPNFWELPGEYIKSAGPCMALVPFVLWSAP